LISRDHPCWHWSARYSCGRGGASRKRFEIVQLLLEAQHYVLHELMANKVTTPRIHV
jgi:hypothetical protein